VITSGAKFAAASAYGRGSSRASRSATARRRAYSADLPQLLRGDLVHGRPRGGVGRAVEPVLTEVAVEQLPHRLAEPGRDVHAVGDVRDRDVVDGAVGPHGLPHLARDLAVATRDAVGGAARAQRELRDPARLGRVGAAEADDLLGVDAERAGDLRQRLGDLVRRVGVVAGRDRRVGGEDRARAGALQRGLERAVVLAAGELERDERGVALVEVHDARLDPHRLQRAHAADAEQHVLGQARVLVADVQARGDPARGLGVLGPVRVEQEQRHAADVHAPDLRDDLRVGDRHGDRDRLAVVAGDERGGQAVRVRVDPVLVLPAAVVDALAEVAVAVQQADRDQRPGAVGGLLEDVARERAEAARVDRERAVEPVLGGEVRDRAVRRGRAVVRGTVEVGADAGLDGRGAFEQLRVLRGGLQAGGRRLLQLLHRILGDLVPALGVEVAEDGGAVRVPSPAVVVGEPGENAQRFW
jgi:hypothetical protein